MAVLGLLLCCLVKRNLLNRTKVCGQMYKAWCVYISSFLSDSEILTLWFVRVKNPLVYSLSSPDSWTGSFKVDYQCRMMHLVSLHKALWKSAVKHPEADNRITWNFIQDFCPVTWGSYKSVTLSTQVPHLRTFLPKSLFYGDMQGCTSFPLNSVIASHNQRVSKVSSSSLPWEHKTMLPISKVNTLASSFYLLCWGTGPVLLKNASHREREREKAHKQSWL